VLCARVLGAARRRGCAGTTAGRDRWCDAFRSVFANACRSVLVSTFRNVCCSGIWKPCGARAPERDEQRVPERVLQRDLEVARARAPERVREQTAVRVLEVASAWVGACGPEPDSRVGRNVGVSGEVRLARLVGRAVKRGVARGARSRRASAEPARPPLRFAPHVGVRERRFRGPAARTPSRS
jgi:hypothetical protein